MNREVEAFELDKRETGEKGQVVSFTRPVTQESVQLQEEMEEEIALLRKKQRERTHGITE